MNNDWINKLREKSENYSEPAPEGLWDGIEGYVMESSGKRKRTAGGLWILAGTSFAAAAAAIFFFLGNREPAYPVTGADITSENITDIAVIPAEPAEEPVSARPYAQDTKRYVSEHKKVINDVMPTGGGATYDITGKIGQNTEPEENAVSDISDTGDMIAMNSSTETVPERIEDIFFPEEKNERKSSNAVDIKISISNVPGNSSTSSGYGMMYGSDAVASMLSSPQETPEYFSKILMKNNGREIRTKTRHYQPVRAGVSALWNITGRLALETGLTYSLLMSDISSGTDLDYYRMNQTLHYIGIPLNLNFSMWRNKRFNIYLSGGGLAEKCVYGNSRIDYAIDSDRKVGENERIRIRPLQWSANASAGAEVRFTDFAGFYIEPGVSYFFDNGSFVENIYKEKPFNFNFKFGIRFSFGRQDR